MNIYAAALLLFNLHFRHVFQHFQGVSAIFRAFFFYISGKMWEMFGTERIYAYICGKYLNHWFVRLYYSPACETILITRL